MSKKRRVGEPEDIMDEQPDDSDWLWPPVPVPCKPFTAAVLTDAPTIEDPEDDIWYEVSEQNDDDQSQQ